MKIITSLLCLLSTSAALAGFVKPLSESTCQKDYLDLFSKDTITMTVVFGYDDISANKTNDQKSYELFVKTLTTPCPKWDQRLCGFVKKSSSPTVLTKKIFGPDGKPKILKVVTDYSSVSTDDKSNRTNPLQKIKSKAMQDLFVHGLKNSEIIIYQGHSRDGGGPSFAPPVLLDNGHVNYDYYHKNKADKNRMVNALAETPNKARIVAIISCSSIRWFSKSIASGAPASGIIGTTEAFTTGNFKESFPLMENILSYQCLMDTKIQDSTNSSQIAGNKNLKIPAKNLKLTQAQLDKQTLETLAMSLRSPDIKIRKEAYLEIKSYNPELYTPKVQEELKNYSFGNTIKKNL